MGTRSLTVLCEEAKGKKPGREIVVLYRQMDGYPTGHGQGLADFLSDFKIVNGLSLNENKIKIANGAGCLAAQVIAYFKDSPGEFYLHPAKTRDTGEEWIYTVYPRQGEVWIKVQAGAMTFFGLPGTKQATMPTLFEGKASTFDAEEIERVRKGIEVRNDFLEEQPQV